MHIAYRAVVWHILVCTYKNNIIVSRDEESEENAIHFTLYNIHNGKIVEDSCTTVRNSGHTATVPANKAYKKDYKIRIICMTNLHE